MTIIIAKDGLHYKAGQYGVWNFLPARDRKQAVAFASLLWDDIA